MKTSCERTETSPWGAIAAQRALPGVVDAVGQKTTVLFDSGIRRGADVIKTMASPARRSRGRSRRHNWLVEQGIEILRRALSEGRAADRRYGRPTTRRGDYDPSWVEREAELLQSAAKGVGVQPKDRRRAAWSLLGAE
jgi:hypothetical protein